MKVLKYTVDIDGRPHTVPLPSYVAVLHVDYQASSPGKLTFWAEHREDDAASVLRTFRVFATGEEVPGNAIYHGTALLIEGTFVYHLFELPA